MYVKALQIISSTLKTNILSVLVWFFIVALFSQENTKNHFVSANVVQNKLQKNQSIFFSDTPIFIAKNSVFSLQLENIQFNKEVFGDGLLHIANTHVINVVSLRPLSIAHIEIKNTQLSLHSEFQLSGEIKLVKATILLNEFNLITAKELLFDDNVSNVLENSTGVWIRLQTSFLNSLPKSSHINNTNTISFALIETQPTYFNSANIIARIKTYNQTNQNNFYQVSKPPPKMV